MPNSSEMQLDRREAIRQLLQKKPAATQKSLVEALVQRGFVATQSSVSRDLREIGAIKSEKPKGRIWPESMIRSPRTTVRARSMNSTESAIG